MKTTQDTKNSTIEKVNNIQFSDIFNLEEIQRLQNIFSDASGVASIITHPDGTPITNPSNFCRLCSNIICKTEKGRSNCYCSDSFIGSQNPSGPVMLQCLNSGLMDAGISITVGGKHVANWVIGQARNEELDEQRIIQYADEIGANREDFIEALSEVPVMSVEQFNKVSKMLVAFSNEISIRAYNNFQLKNQIAEQKKDTVVLEKSERLLSSIYDTVGDIIFHLKVESDGCYRFISVNQTFCKVTGLCEEMVVGKLVDEVIPEPSLSLVLEKYKQAIKKRSIVRWVETSDYPNGQLIGDVCISPVFDEKGHCTHLVGSVHDITERNRAGVLLQESEENMRYIVKHDPNAIAVYDCKLHYIAVSERYLHDYGVKEEDIIGKYHYEVFPEMPQKWKDVHQRCLAGAIESNDDDYFERPDGSITYNRWECRPWRKIDGEIGGIITYTEVTTERKKVENALKETNNKLINAQRVAKIGSWENSLTTNDLQWSEEMYHILGFPPNTSINLEDATRIFPPEEIMRFQQAVSNAINKDVPYSIDYKIVRLDGAVRYIHDEGEVVRDEHGQAVRMIGTTQDITDRRRAEVIIQQEKDFSEVALNSLPGLFYLFDDQGKFLRWNKNFEYLSGYTAEEITNLSPFDLFDKVDKINIAVSIQEVFQNGKATVEAYFQSKDKTRIPVFFTGNRFHFENKQCLVGVGIDLTQLKLAEEQIAKLSNAVEQAADIVFITNREGIIEYLNPAFETITGYRKEEALGNTPRILKSGLMDLQYYQKVWETILSGKVLRGEVINRNKNGKIFYYDQTITPLIGVNGKVTHFISTGKDITERKHSELILQEKNEELTKKNEELIKAKEKAEESDNLKTAFLNNISHEIRTPFNGILGFLSILQNDGLTASERAEYTNIVDQSAFRLMNTINDIVEISQIQTGQMKLTASDTNIKRLMGNLFDKFKADAKSQGLEYTLNNYLPNDVEYVYTDSTKLNTILSILIGNAIKFTKAGSVELGIKFRDKAHLVFTSVGAIGEPFELEFSVKDTGIGIPIDRQEAIFELFMQADFSITRPFEGSGLGLSIAKAYVEMLGGRIWVKSDPKGKSGEKGSTFYFTLPYNAIPIEKPGIEKVVSSNSTANPINSKVSGLKILIVEDDETSELYLRNAIKLFSKEIQSARTGVEAVEACRKNPDFDLILMDIKMQVMDGLEATRQIRQFNEEVIIIAQTAFGLTGDQEKAIAAGCNDYISKPVKKDQLIELIQKYL